MINPRLLKNSARINSTLSDQKSAALDVDFRKLQGPSLKQADAGRNSDTKFDKRSVMLNGLPIVVQIKQDSVTDEYVVCLEE
jgi:hypothetical protein